MANLSNIHSNLYEPIEEVEVEKEENKNKKIISESIQKRLKATKHISLEMTKELGNLNRNRSILIQSDPIDEEIEVDDDELYSENNFYISWEKHKRYLLTQDEQQKLMNEDAHSSSGIFQKKESTMLKRRTPWQSHKIGSRKGRKKETMI